MECKQLGSTGVKVPDIGLGTYNFAAGVEPLRAGVERGACFIDTAESYGTEPIVGEAIRGRRDRVFLATKVSPRNFRRGDVIAAAERSLRQLGTDYIDLYQLHWPNYTVPIAETMAAMEHLADSGKIRFIGVSSFSVAELKRANGCLSRHKIVSNQVRYSLIDRTVETGLLQYCQRSAITLIAFSPLGISFPRIGQADPEGVLGRVAGAVGRDGSADRAELADRPGQRDRDSEGFDGGARSRKLRCVGLAPLAGAS